MQFSDIKNIRLHNQLLNNQPYTTPAEVVSWLGAMQGQDYEMCKWAIGSRLPHLKEVDIENALNKGEILRTHILRPTWHLVSPTDIRWMMQLTAPHLERVLAGYAKSVGLDTKTCLKSNTIIEKALNNEPNLTRDELMQKLGRHKIEASGNKAANIMFYAEITCLVCNGERKGKQIAYTLLDNRAPLSQPLHREEALARLAKLYFQSHSPATLKDFTWWSGLPVGDARKGIEGIKEQLEVIEIDKTIYYVLPSKMPFQSPHGVHLLPSFDEYMVSYSDRSAALPPQYLRQTITSNGIFAPIIVHQGHVIGLWRRAVKPKYIEIELQPFETLDAELEQAIKDRFNAYQTYMGGGELRFV